MVLLFLFLLFLFFFFPFLLNEEMCANALMEGNPVDFIDFKFTRCEVFSGVTLDIIRDVCHSTPVCARQNVDH